MPPKLDATEGIVLNFINEQNKPLNSQIVADSLQKYGIKKTAAQKALDSLADAGKITFKEYGKQKIYLAKQDQFNIPTNEELEHMKKEISNLQENLAVESNAVNALGAGRLLTIGFFCSKFENLNTNLVGGVIRIVVI
ncbi:hypothetical protein O6H91_08G085500 [Diphasiastrum complanatum]|uniref:Uncharacterized protein n=1 Tax=Diphasiastrum complanatum TaxID=34168 RepID=A0ACC2CZI8_DIPCM|nr:hypothetical protein O6H91_08G085500 [Diphasiastrum complanatum]